MEGEEERTSRRKKEIKREVGKREGRKGEMERKRKRGIKEKEINRGTR